ncbi:MAG: helix-turn-helix transcriptional regulator [Lachnospiraceae bacterium]|nr:helix-turn-helix transcriptional regulator [Lachnospiraceae bacterium]
MSKVKDKNIDIAKALLRVRQDHRLSQEQFAQSLGVTRQAVSRWEMGISIPSHSTLKQISEIYEVSIDTILNNQSCDNTPSEPKAPMIPSFTLGLLFVCIGFLGVIVLVFFAEWMRVKEMEVYHAAYTDSFQYMIRFPLLLVLVVAFVSFGIGLLLLLKHKPRKETQHEKKNF